MGMSCKASVSMISSAFRPEDVDHSTFDKEGFAIYTEFLTQSALESLRKSYTAIIDQLHESVHPEWVMSLHQVLPEKNWLWKLATEPILLDFVERHLGPNLVLYSTQLAYKPPGGGRDVPWHQDGERCRTLWIPLDDISDTSGGLEVIPGLHKRGRVKKYKRVTVESYDSAVFNLKHSVFEIDLSLYGSDAGTQRELEDGERSKKRTRISQRESPSSDGQGLKVTFAESALLCQSVLCRMPAGSLEVHHPTLPHRSVPNKSANHRRVIIMRYQPCTEPLNHQTFTHFRTGKQIAKKNYLVRGHFPRNKTETEESPPPQPRRSERLGTSTRLHRQDAWIRKKYIEGKMN